jgi:hypothetical protein
MKGDDKRKAALAALTAYADELRTEIQRQTARLKRELEGVEQSIRVLEGDGTRDVGGQARPLLDVGGRYSGVGPQAAVEQFLEEHPGQFFRPVEIVIQLKAQGFSVPNPKLATQQVAIALGRAATKGLAVDGKREGKRVYKSTKQQGGIGQAKEIG